MVRHLLSALLVTNPIVRSRQPAYASIVWSSPCMVTAGVLRGLNKLKYVYTTCTWANRDHDVIRVVAN
eukprot:12886996-Prorocentrum_lima.AAC.1